MDLEQEWNLGPAKARVTTSERWANIAIVGTLTAQAYERLHLLIAHFARPRTVDGYTLTLSRGVLLACTNISAVEAAVRLRPLDLPGVAGGERQDARHVDAHGPLLHAQERVVFLEVVVQELHGRARRVGVG